MEQTVDLKKISLLFIKRIKNIVFFTIIGALIAAVTYYVYGALNSEGQFYRVSAEYYIDFNLEEYPGGVDYYNAYTWDSILRDDPIVDVAMESLPDTYDKEFVKSTIVGEMLGDYRILTVHVTAKDEMYVQEIAKAVEKSLLTFPQRIDMISSIERWSYEECYPVVEENRILNASAVGALIGFVVGLFWFVFAYILDDAIYVESDYTKYFDLPFLGMITRGKSELCNQELQSNLDKFIEKEKKYYLVHVNEKSMLPGNVYQTLTDIYKAAPMCVSMVGKDLELLKTADGVILVTPWGKKNSRMIEKTITFLKKQGCVPYATMFYDADDRFLKKYYGMK